MAPSEVLDAVNDAVPFARHAGIAVVDLAPGAATATLAEQVEVTNHVGTVHAGALFAVADSASGAAVLGALGDRLFSTRMVVREATIRFVAPARGQVTARAEAAGAVDAVAALDTDGRADVPVTVILEADGRTVAEVSVTWNLRALSG
jgi:acyl-coenzyme A thioesterase PaaI-like protein